MPAVRKAGLCPCWRQGTVTWLRESKKAIEWTHAHRAVLSRQYSGAIHENTASCTAGMYREIQPWAKPCWLAVALVTLMWQEIHVHTSKYACIRNDKVSHIQVQCGCQCSSKTEDPLANSAASRMRQSTLIEPWHQQYSADPTLLSV